MLTVTIHPDESSECPMDWDGQWKLYSFNYRHSSSANPHDFFDEYGNVPIGLQRKLSVGTAFWLSYFEHGSCLWGRRGTMSHMPDFRWDGAEMAGILLWENPVTDMGAKTLDDRAKDADGFLETYTNYCNGNVYGYVIENEDGEHVDSCWGYYDDNSLKEAVKEAVDGEDFQVAPNDYAEMVA